MPWGITGRPRSPPDPGSTWQTTTAVLSPPPSCNASGSTQGFLKLTRTAGTETHRDGRSPDIRQAALDRRPGLGGRRGVDDVSLPSISASGGTSLGSLVPADAPALQASESQASSLRFSPQPNVVVVRNPHGLSVRRQAQLTTLAARLSSGRIAGFGSIAGAVPLINTLGAPPFARERRTTALLYLYFRPSVSPVSRASVAERLTRQVIGHRSGELEGVTGEEPAQAAPTELIDRRLKWVELARLSKTSPRQTVKPSGDLGLDRAYLRLVGCSAYHNRSVPPPDSPTSFSVRPTTVFGYRRSTGVTPPTCGNVVCSGIDTGSPRTASRCAGPASAAVAPRAASNTDPRPKRGATPACLTARIATSSAGGRRFSGCFRFASGTR